ncbi:acetate uptake transporter [Acidiphilium sp. AL]|uniref:Acetate uptake transporter n=1 Tax=Acidiphilium iwatense TaxID=768198 RepID=A0ABS9E5J0_9PROT|nr:MULTISPECIES: acetate uptake transporter [Acidiphilium]MCF3948839.1 acetate uptake transporter [Acidiphilium iwatense]MCU4162194.1 acetate uptake transporter [Acidiphilium sp. AL]
MKLANPAPVGLFAFALTTWLLSLVNADFLSGASVPLILAMAFAFGGSIQIIVGVMEFVKGNTFGVAAFGGYGAFWWSFALFEEFFLRHVPASAVSWYLVVWAAFSITLWISSFAINWALNATLFAAWVTLLFLAAAPVFGDHTLTVLGGYGGLVTAVLAFYLATATLLNEIHGRTILAVGDRIKLSPVFDPLIRSL